MLLITITSWWEALGSTEQIYWGIALISTSIFVVQLFLSFIGVDAEVEADLDGGDGLGLISFRSFIAFSTFFGWGGVGALSEGFGSAQALMIAFLCGFIAMVTLAYMLAKLFKMQESGTVDIYDAISKEAEVYLRIPEAKDGKGKVHVNVEDKLMEFDAISDAGPIATGSKVKVKDILNDNVMLVTAL